MNENEALEIIEKYNLKTEVIKQGTFLYRFINKAPADVKLGMSENRGRNGRLNLWQNVYYCCKSMDGILQEVGIDVSGAMIVSEVTEQLNLGFVTNHELNLLLRGRTFNEPKEIVHSEILSPLGFDRKITYEYTSKIFEDVTKINTDGIVFPSVHSIDVVMGCIKFQLDESTGFSNIALTESGYKKIKEWNPIVYWH